MVAAAPSAGRDDSLAILVRAAPCVAPVVALCESLLWLSSPSSVDSSFCVVCVCVAAAGAVELRLYFKFSAEEHAFSPAHQKRLSYSCHHAVLFFQIASLTQETPVIIPFPIPSFIFATLNVVVDADRWRWATAGDYRF
ncbi:hypothetical protein ACLKA6_002678 [Drosophila palustris]